MPVRSGAVSMNLISGYANTVRLAVGEYNEISENANEQRDRQRPDQPNQRECKWQCDRQRSVQPDQR